MGPKMAIRAEVKAELKRNWSAKFLEQFEIREVLY